MITDFFVENFKSFHAPTRATLSDLLVVAGTNSGGKSTLIQSLLLLTQTLENPNRKVVLDLGGKYIQFSEFRDAVYGRPKSGEATFTIGFSIDIPGSSANRFGTRAGILQTERQIKAILENPTKFRVSLQRQELAGKAEVTLTFGAHRSGPIIKRAEYKMYFTNLDLSIDLTAQKIGTKYQVTYDLSSKEAQTETSISAQEILGDFDCLFGLLRDDQDNGPEQVGGSKTTPSSIRSSRDRFMNFMRLFSSIGIRIEDIPEIGQQLTAKFRDLCEIPTLDNGTNLLAELIHKIYQFAAQKGLHREQLTEIEFEHCFITSSFRFVTEFMPTIIHDYFGSIFEQSNQIISNYLLSLQYIGPLRAKPERAYLALGTPINIGIGGENAVPILWLDQEEKVESKTTIGAESRKLKLVDAVEEWLSEFGIATSFHITKPKQVIYQAELESAPNSKIMVTIADVGFGVSQLLPVIVAGLRAKPGSTLILEQPEIHLHPKLQGKLADFLVCLIELRVKVIVETHSEHLINMLRLRIIQDPTGKLQKRIGIIFVRNQASADKSPENKEGSFIENLKVDEYGQIVNWPPDFFPETSRLNEEILKAMMDKYPGA